MSGVGPGRPGRTSRLGWSGSVMPEVGELWRAMHLTHRGRETWKKTTQPLKVADCGRLQARPGSPKRVSSRVCSGSDLIRLAWGDRQSLELLLLILL